MRRTVLLLLTLAAPALAAGPHALNAPHAPPVRSGDAVIFLVRHAETAPDGSRNPPLSTAGVARAARLAVMLEDAGIEALHTTPYLRTETTAAAVGTALGLEPREYDPSRMEPFADSILEAGGRHLVVGHSNTTPVMVALLGGEPGDPIAEAEHDRLYVLIQDGTSVRTLLLRY